jgi:glycosyltransferase involved in cell wall biosynthesis
MCFFLLDELTKQDVSINIYSWRPKIKSLGDTKIVEIFVRIPGWVWLLRKIEYRFFSRTNNLQFSFFNKKVAKKHLVHLNTKENPAILCLTYQSVIDLRKAGVTATIVLWTHGFDYNNSENNLKGINSSNIVFFSSNAFIRELRNKFLFEGVFPPFIQLKNPFPIDTYRQYFQPNLPDNPRVYFFGGGNLERKGSCIVEHLIKTWRPNGATKLIVAGHGITAEKIVKYGQLEIQYCQFLEGEVMIKTMAQCHFILMPSLWFENFPYLLYEGLSLGLIPIVSNLGGLPEMFNNELGYLIQEPNNPKDWEEALNQTLKMPITELENLRFHVRKDFIEQVIENNHTKIFFNNVFVNNYKSVN